MCGILVVMVDPKSVKILRQASAHLPVTVLWSDSASGYQITHQSLTHPSTEYKTWRSIHEFSTVAPRSFFAHFGSVISRSVIVLSGLCKVDLVIRSLIDA